MQPVVHTLITLTLVVVSLYAFTRGFFLTRYELEDAVSDCTGNKQSSACFSPTITSHPPITTLILLLIDALRFDYLYYNTSAAYQPNPYYSNQLTSIHTANPLHSRIYQQYVDPPTVTMQRLKGLTTGTLPTFIDVRQNFDFDIHLQEDHWLRQLRHTNTSTIVHMGDDTWLSLFAVNDTFTRSYAYPSFNVKDLHTVDDGVLSHIYEQLDSMQRTSETPSVDAVQRNVLIAHFLGVDHVGHRYGPNHPEMTSKLQQMNDMLTAVMQYVDSIPKSMLIVLGDHGMTEDGNHGGATREETNAALFVYAHDKLPAQAEIADIATINQIDLVPTLSYLLGLPIPYSSLGQMVTSLIASEDTLHALRVNTHQILRYLKHYQQHAHSFNAQALQQLEQRLMTLDKSDTANADELHSAYTQWLLDATNMCRHEWTTFDLSSMTAGAAGLCIAVSWCVRAFRGVRNEYTTNAAVQPAAKQQPTVSSSQTALTTCYTVTLLSLLAYYQGLFTNSFTIVDPMVQRTMFVVTTLVGAAFTCAQSQVIDKKLAATALCLAITARTFKLDNTMTSDQTLSAAFFSSWHISMMTASLLAWLLGVLYAYSHTTTAASVSVRLYQPWLILHTAVVYGYWLLPHTNNFVRLWLPNLTYFAFGLSLLNSCYVGVTHRLQSTSVVSVSNGTANTSSAMTSTAPSALSSMHQLLLLMFGTAALAYMLLHGPLSSIVVLQYSIAAWLISQLYSRYSLPSSLTALLLWLLSNTLWYATNHRADFARLHVSCSFVGFDVFSYYPAGALLMYNTFGHVILTAIVAAVVQTAPQPLAPSQQRTSVYPTLTFLWLARTLCSVVNVTIQRRHLMVWAIFAPKMLFDSIETIIALTSITVCQLIIDRSPATSFAKQHHLQ